MFRRLRLAALAFSALAAAGCATTMNVSSHVARSIDFAQYRTYDWGPADALPTGDPRLDENPFFRDHVQGAVEQQLAARGFKGSTSGTPDLLIHYHASIDWRIKANLIDRDYGYCATDDCPGGVIEYEAGTLVLDIVDTRTNRVIWRGWAEDSVESILNNQDRMARQIDEAVRRMIEMLPPAL